MNVCCCLGFETARLIPNLLNPTSKGTSLLFLWEKSNLTPVISLKYFSEVVPTGIHLYWLGVLLESSASQQLSQKDLENIVGKKTCPGDLMKCVYQKPFSSTRLQVKCPTHLVLGHILRCNWDLEPFSANSNGLFKLKQTKLQVAWQGLPSKRGH